MRLADSERSRAPATNQQREKKIDLCRASFTGRNTTNRDRAVCKQTKIGILKFLSARRPTALPRRLTLTLVLVSIFGVHLVCVCVEPIDMASIQLSLRARRSQRHPGLAITV